MQAIKAARDGRTVAGLAEAFGFNERTVYQETPQQMKFPYALWTLALVHRRLGKQVTVAGLAE